MSDGQSSVVVVFPGQGSQRPGMARDFCDAFAVSRQVFAEASDALDLDLVAICAGEDGRIDLTEFTQPAILTAEIAMFRALQSELGLTASRFGGHSLGEYTALCAAGVLPLATAVRLVRRRGALMQTAVPVGEGAMTAVLGTGVAERDLSASLARLEVDVANRNAPDQIVLSGPAARVPTAAERVATSLGGDLDKLVPLNVSAPFHSWMMRPIEPTFRAELEASRHVIDPRRARAVAANVTGGFHAADTDAIIDALTRQISGTVDWIANMRALAANASEVFEIGPNKPLRGFFQRVGVTARAIISVRTAERELRP
jgi:[acyl-carrier-protein] S-malonyltransferase/trans-AT polyketide synthase/acyltransferase/oxidoreductase domain-containing protein